jgi:hypothetical protein
MAGRSWRREDHRRSCHRPVPLCYCPTSEDCKGRHCIWRGPTGWRWSQRGKGGGLLGERAESLAAAKG